MQYFATTYTLAELSIGPYLLWVAILIGVIIASTAGILLLRKKVLDPDSGRANRAGVLEELRTLRDSGKITTDEFDAARKRMVQRIAADAIGRGDVREGQPANGQTARKQPPAQ